MDPFQYSDQQLTGNVSHAVRANNIVALEQLIENGADVDVFDNRGFLPLHEACYNGFLECLRILLISENAHHRLNDRTHEGETSLFLASSRGHPSVVEYLLQQSVDVNLPNNEGVSPLHIACKLGHDECVKILLQYGANINQEDHYDGSTPLLEAARVNNFECLKILLDHPGIDINKENADSATALLLSFDQPDSKCMELLLQKGADVHAHGRPLNPLCTCCVVGDIEKVQLLLDWGADVNCQSHYESPLEEAVFRGYPELVRLLLEQGANYEAVMNGEKTQNSSPLATFKYLFCGKSPKIYITDCSVECFCVLLDYVKEQVSDLCMADLGDVVEFIAKKSPSEFLEALLARGLLDTTQKIKNRKGISRTILDLAVMGCNAAAILYLLGIEQHKNEKKLYKKSRRYVKLIVNSFHKYHGNQGLQCLKLLLKYLLPTAGHCLLEDVLTTSSLPSEIVQLFLQYDVYVGLKPWKVYNNLVGEDEGWKAVVQRLSTPPPLQHLCRHIMRSILNLVEFYNSLDTICSSVLSRYILFQEQDT